MTNIKYIETISKNDTNFDITIAGHSEGERNSHDNDLCCCAVSVLGCTLLANIQSLYGNNKKFKLETEEEKGLIKIKFTIPNDFEEVYREQAKAVISTIFKGFDLISKNYPKNVKLTEKIKVKKS